MNFAYRRMRAGIRSGKWWSPKSSNSNVATTGQNPSSPLSTADGPFVLVNDPAEFHISWFNNGPLESSIWNIPSDHIMVQYSRPIAVITVTTLLQAPQVSSYAFLNRLVQFKEVIMTQHCSHFKPTSTGDHVLRAHLGSSQRCHNMTGLLSFCRVESSLDQFILGVEVTRILLVSHI
ncbi:hypothetical protein CPB86DRAFT_97391 [Serendipita vermifera]|nr:hypothetical protein CPB86DRAFT_97391 [Serendipita vermifera]